MRRLPESMRLLGERYKTSVIKLDEFIISHWEQRVRQVDRSEKLRSVYARTLEKARAIPIDRTTAVTYFKNSISSEWEEIRRAYSKGMRERIRGEIIGATGIDPHAMYLDSHKKAMKVLETGRIETSTQFHVIQEFMEELDAEDSELIKKCQEMLDAFEARLMGQSAPAPRT